MEDEDKNILLIALMGSMQMSQAIREDHNCSDYISIEEHIIPSVEERLGLKIQLTPSNWNICNFKGNVKRFEKTAEIYYPKSYNPCNQRFVIAKEIAHLVNDSDCARVDTREDAEALCAYITNPEFARKNANEKMKSVINAEENAELYALELLIPCSHRANLKAIKKKVGIVAEKYKVPKSKVELYFDPAYASIVEQAHETYLAAK